MRNTQTKTIDLLRAGAATHGLELVQDQQWSNTGTLRIEREDSVTPLVSISYNFQDTYATFDVAPASGIGHGGKGHIYAKPEELMSKLVTPLVAIMAGLVVQS